MVGTVMLAKAIFWTRPLTYWVPKQNRRTRVNLVTRAQTFCLESIYLLYIIYEGTTFMFDHRLTKESRLILTMVTSVLFDLLVWVMFPMLVMWETSHRIFLWQNCEQKVQKLEFKIISGHIEPRRDNENIMNIEATNVIDCPRLGWTDDQL